MRETGINRGAGGCPFECALGTHPKRQAPRSQDQSKSCSGKANRCVSRQHSLVAGNPEVGPGPQNTPLSEADGAKRRPPYGVQQGFYPHQTMKQIAVRAFFDLIEIKARAEVPASPGKYHRVDGRMGDARCKVGNESLHQIA